MSQPSLRSPERFYVPGSEHSDAFRGQCMRCGVCTIRCPTFEVLRDERDGPRGRVAMAIELIESDAPPKPETVRHLDRCLSCLACSTTCPFGVDHGRLWDAARARIETSHPRPPGERLQRFLLATLLPRPRLFRFAMKGAAVGRTVKAALPGRLARLVDMAPRALPQAAGLHTGLFAAVGTRKLRVAVLAGCAQEVLRPSIHESTVRFLTRHGCEVVVPPEAGCCGSLVLHMGRTEEARRYARRNIAAWETLVDGGGLDAIVINTSGCGTTVKAYADLFEGDPQWQTRARRIGSLARDVSEVAAQLPLARRNAPPSLRIAYHNPCSLENGQGIRSGPEQLLRSAGFELAKLSPSPACCGSAGTYNMLQPEIAAELGKRKATALESVRPDAIATANIGCQMQVASYASVPVVHTIELLDWATGGPVPAELERGGRR